MSIDPTGEPNVVDSSSIEDRLKARLQSKMSQRSETLPVLGYESIFAARYRALTFEEMRRIGKRNAKERDDDVKALNVAADTLVAACEEVFEVLPDGSYRSLEHPWSVALANRLGVGGETITTARRALMAIIGADHFDVMNNLEQYAEWRNEEVVDTASEEAEDFLR